MSQCFCSVLRLKTKYVLIKKFTDVIETVSIAE